MNKWETGTSATSGKGLAICDGPIVIAQVLGTGYPLGKGIGNDDVANARLIAAAPELLEALKAMLAYDVRMYETSATARLRVPPEVEQARAAIAKATLPNY